MGYLRAFGLVALLIASSALSGCVRTQYVHIDSDGVRHVSNRPLGQREIEVIDLRPDPTGASTLTASWRGHGDWNSDVPVRMCRINVVSTDGFTKRAVSYYTNRSDFTAATPAGSGAAAFALRRPAGTFTFERESADLPVRGTVRFQSDPAYVVALREMFDRDVTAEQTVELALANLELDYARAVRQAVETATLDDVLILRRAGVDADYVRALHGGGYALSAGEIVSLRRAGVDADYAVELRQKGYTLPADGIIRLRRAGIAPDFAGGVRAAGFGTEIDEVIALRRAGIDVDYLSSFTSAGYRFGSDDIVKLRRAGVDAQYAADLREGGYDLSADEIIQLRRGGVDTAYALALSAPPKEPLTVDEIIQLRRRGIDAATIRKLRR